MKHACFRKATPDDFPSIFRMSFDVWGQGSLEDYFEECQTSPKYARGVWYVLEAEDGDLVSSLIVYQLSAGQYGIGSIATPLPLRRQGYASKLVSEILEHIEQESPGAVIFLYSDIDPAFYERFKFQQIPKSAQRDPTTTCMVRGKNTEDFKSPLDTPEYF
jgi:predicted N-acetyltransferase YhbS